MFNEVVFDFRGIFQGTRIDECVDVFSGLQFREFNALRMEQARKQAHYPSRRSTSSIRMLFSIMYFASFQNATTLKYSDAAAKAPWSSGGVHTTWVCTPPPMIIVAMVNSMAHSAGGNTRALKTFVR